MTCSLYGLYDGVSEGIGWVIGKKPYDLKYWQDYMRMEKRVNLKNDFGWGEVADMQNFLRKADIWFGFPAKGYTLVNAEFKGGDENQRIDLLYMRNDGALLPCELKIGCENKDAHGQLIRYISDLYFQKIDLAWAREANQNLLDRIKDITAQSLLAEKFETFIADNRIEDRFVRILPQTGVIMDEGFTPQLLKAVRYLNGYCGFSIRLIEINAFVENSWRKDSMDFKFRLDFVDVQ
jgi:hypothetical protein